MKITKAQNQNIYRVVRNFNRKIQRLHDKGYDVNLNKVTTKQVKATVQTKGELQLYLRELELFGRRGAEVVNRVEEDGSEFLEYHKSIQDLQRKRALLQAKRELKFYSNRVPTSLGKKQAGTLKQMGSVLVRNLEKQVEVLSRKELTKSVTSATKRVLLSKERQQWVYDEFLRILDDYGALCNVSQEQLSAIRFYLENMKADKFIEMYNTEGSIKHVLELYNELKTISGRSSIQENLTEGKSTIGLIYKDLTRIFKDYVDEDVLKNNPYF